MRPNPRIPTDEPAIEEAAAPSDAAETEKPAAATSPHGDAVETLTAEDETPAPSVNDPELPSGEEEPAAEVTPVIETPTEVPVEESAQEPAEGSEETPVADDVVEKSVSGEGGWMAWESEC